MLVSKFDLIIRKASNLNTYCMKTVNNVFDYMCSPEVISQAIDNGAKGKHSYKEVKKVLANKEWYVQDLRYQLLNNKFIPSPYNVDLRKTEYGKEREIFKLPFYPDRVVQHCIAIVMKDRWEKALTFDTYACLKGRGINCKNPNFDIVKKVKRAIAEDPEGTTYCLKMDIKKCYPNVDNNIMAKINRRYCRDKRLLRLLDMITFNCKGLPIGNYLSQLQINIYLAPMDRFIKEVLGVKHYFRYMDDIVIFGASKEELQTIQWRVMNFLFYNLNMVFNDKRQVFKIGTNNRERGLDFVGYVFYRYHTLLRKRVKTNMWRKRNLERSMSSYLGMAKSCNSTHLMNLILKNVEKGEREEVEELSTVPGLIKYKSKYYAKTGIHKVVDKPITLLDFELRKSRQNPRKKFMILRFMNNEENKKQFIWGTFQALIFILEQFERATFKSKNTIIRYNNFYYFNNTIE